MSHIAPNLRYLRKRKGLTQQQFADLMGIKRSLVGAYEEYRAQPKYDLLKKMAAYFGLSMDELTQSKIDADWKPADIGGASSVRVLSITTDRENNENIELVPVKASAGYLNGYADPEYITDLPKFSLPMFAGGTFRAFELKGDSMLPLNSGTIVIAEYVENWYDVRPGKTYIIVSKSEGVVYKRIGNRFKPEKGLHLMPDNNVYDSYWIETSDIIEIWKAKAYLSTELPEPSTQPSLESLTHMLADMQKKITDLNQRSNQ